MGPVVTTSTSLIIVLTFTISMVFAVSRIYEHQLQLVPFQPERAIRLAFDAQLGKANYQVLSEIDYVNLREVGGLPVFSDSYFPFALGAVSEWDRRRALSEDFFVCIKETRSPQSCSSILRDYKNVYLLSASSDLDGEVAFQVETSNNKVYVYKL